MISEKDRKNREELDALPNNESECRPYYEKLPWKKAIVVYIVLPD